MRTTYLTLMLFFAVSFAFAQIDQYKAAYIYNFINYIEWPTDYYRGDFVIGVMGEDGVASALKVMATKKNVKGQKLRVDIFKNAQEVGKCHIIYVPSGESNKIKDVIEKLESYNTLIIADKSGMLKNGACLNFMLQESKLRFEIDKKTIKRRGLKINSALERLAVNVY